MNLDVKTLGCIVNINHVVLMGTLRGLDVNYKLQHAFGVINLISNYKKNSTYVST